MQNSRDIAADVYDETDERVAIIHMRQDIVLIFSEVDSLNEQLWMCKWLLSVIALGIIYIGYCLS